MLTNKVLFGSPNRRLKQNIFCATVFFLLAEPFKTSFYCPTSHRKGKEAVYFLYITLWSYVIQPFLIEWQLWGMIIFLSTTAYPPQAQPGLTNFTRSVDRSLVCAHLNNYSNAFNIKVPNVFYWFLCTTMFVEKWRIDQNRLKFSSGFSKRF